MGFYDFGGVKLGLPLSSSSLLVSRALALLVASRYAWFEAWGTSSMAIESESDDSA